MRAGCGGQNERNKYKSMQGRSVQRRPLQNGIRYGKTEPQRTGQSKTEAGKNNRRWIEQIRMWRSRIAKSSFLRPGVCVAVSLLLWGYLTYLAPDAKSGLLQGQIEREGYGGSRKEEELVVSGLGTEEQTVTVKVSPRVYTREEADAVFFEIMDSLEEEIRGKNESLQAVSENLKLPSYLDEYGVRVRWHSSEPELLSSAGTIEAEIEKKQEVVLQAELSAGEYRADFELPVTLVPKKLTEEELLRKHFSKEVNRLDEQQKQSSSLQLPMEYQGKALSYRSAEKNSYAVIPLLGVLMAMLLLLQEKSGQQKLEKKREQQLLLDYPEVVSKLQVLVGAGMTVRNAWGRMVHDYENVSGKKVRPAYEEMRQTYYQMENGTAEGAAYRDFGRRCRLQPYLKLSSILEQNRKTGTKNLRELLHREVVDAFELRKNLARRLGEEAGTKLLAPLLLLLFVVMIFIMVPAMMTMG